MVVRLEQALKINTPLNVTSISFFIKLKMQKTKSKAKVTAKGMQSPLSLRKMATKFRPVRESNNMMFRTINSGLSQVA
jgi:hypothetical protein